MTKSTSVVKIAGFCLILAVFILNGCATGRAPAIDPAGPQIQAYIRTWPLPAFFPDEPPAFWSSQTVHAQYLTELAIIPAVLKKTDGLYTGEISLPGLEDKGTPFAGIRSEIEWLKEKYPHLKIIVSYGGWAVDGFSQISADPAKLDFFVANVVSFTEKYGLDGADIDWEYPVGPDWKVDIATSPRDRENYLKLLKKLRAGLDELGSRTGKTLTLSVTVPVGGDWFSKKNDVVAVATLVDSIKIKSFELYGGWNRTTGHHANLYKNSADPGDGAWSIDQAVQAYLDAGVPASKLMAGVAFYGKVWQGVPDNGTNGLFQPFRTVAAENFLWNDIRRLSKPHAKFRRYWDDEAKAAWLYDGDTFISYVDPQELQEIAHYVKEKKLGGVIIYEYADDMSGELLKKLAEALQ